VALMITGGHDHTLPEWLEDFTRHCKGSVDQDVMPGALVFGIRDGFPRLSVMCTGDAVDRGPMIDLLSRVASIDSEFLMVGLDAWITISAIDPRTGLEWAPGGPGTYHAEFGDGIGTDVSFGDDRPVRQALIVYGADRTGTVLMSAIPYREARVVDSDGASDRLVLWGEAADGDNEEYGGPGDLVHVMSKMMTMPRFSEWMRDQGKGEVTGEMWDDLYQRVAMSLAGPGRVVMAIGPMDDGDDDDG